MRRRSTFALIALAVAASGCSGGGSSSPAPSTVSPTSTPGATAASKATARFTITIPNAAATGSARRRAYVSKSTQSIGIVYVPQGAAASAATVVNVASAACVAGANGTTCSVDVLAPIGTDTFTVTTYDQANLGGNVLSVGTVTGTVVVAHANSFPLVLGGVVAKIVLAIATSILPAGQTGSTALGVAAYDADGNQIIGTFQTPIALTGATGLTFSSASLASSSPSNVTVTYDGVSRTALSVSATSGSATASASIVPGTNVVYYALPGTTENNPFKIVRGPDGAFYFGEIYGFINNITDSPTDLPGRIGRIDEAGNYSEVQLNYDDPIGLLFVGNDLYVAEQTSSAVSRITNAAAGGFTAANIVDVLMPKNSADRGIVEPRKLDPAMRKREATANGGVDEPRTLVLGPDNNVYVTNYTGDDVAYFDPATFGSGTITEIPTTPAGANPIGITLAPNGEFYTVTFNNGNYAADVIDSFLPGATSMTSIVPSNVPANDVPALYRYITTGSDGNLYYTENDNDESVPNESGRIDQYNLKAGTFTAIAEPAPFEQPDSVERGLTGTVLFNDPSNEAIGIVQTSNLRVTDYPFIDAFDDSATFPNDVVADPDGSYWFTAPTFAAGGSETTLDYTSKIAHFIPAQAWTVYPNLATLDIDGVGASGADLIGVAAASTAGSTFTATSSNPNVCTITQPAGFPLNFVLTGIANGTCSISITDGTRTVTKSVVVTKSTATIDTRKRRIRS